MTDKDIDALVAMPEPTAYRLDWPISLSVGAPRFKGRDWMAVNNREAELQMQGVSLVPLFTADQLRAAVRAALAAPQAETQTLTDEQIDAIPRSPKGTWRDVFRDFARAAIAEFRRINGIGTAPKGDAS